MNVDQLDSRYDIDAATGCWLWSGTTDGRGYPTIHLTEGCRSAARVVWQAEGHSLTAAEDLHPVCGIALCVNPRHRMPVPKGQRVITRRLNKPMVAAARSAVKAGISKRMVADSMNVDERTLRNALSGKHWTAR